MEGGGPVHRSGAGANLDLLDGFWRRRPFHDMTIAAVSALNRRVVIRLEEFTLVLTGATGLKRCDLPTVWLAESVPRHPGGFKLNVNTQAGRLDVSGVDVRLIRNSDLAVLIPPIDP